MRRIIQKKYDEWMDKVMLTKAERNFYRNNDNIQALGFYAGFLFGFKLAKRQSEKSK